MANGFALATLPLAALGCSIYAVWSLYRGWQESRCRPESQTRRAEHPIATAVQTALFVTFSLALLLTGFSILAKTAPQSPYAEWFQSAPDASEEYGVSIMGQFDDLPGTFEIARNDPSQSVVGVSMTNLPAGDLDVARLADRFPELQWLHLQNTHVTDNGLESLHRLPGLRMLALSQTSIGDQGLEQLGQLHDLEELTLCQTRISDIGLEYLEHMSSLKVLDLSDTNVSRRAVRDLRRRLPDCAIRNRNRVPHLPAASCL